MTLENYATLDFSRKSAAAKDLFERVANEASQTTTVLTPVYTTDGTSAFLTQEMSDWFDAYVRPARTSAFQDVLDDFKRHDCKLAEQEFDAIEQRKLQNVANERAVLRQKKEVQLLKDRFDELKLRYDELRSRYGREALAWMPIRYWLILACFMLPEFLINWDSFLKIPGFTPAYATGLILSVAIAFAFSAHSIGKIIKQWKELFGGHVEFAERRKALRELIVGLLLFVIAIAAVGWGRWFFIQGAILEKSILRGGGLEFADLLQFMGAMLGNLLVYLLGVLWSFLRHDAMPGFSELRLELAETQSKLIAAFNKYLTGRNQQHFQKAQKELAQAQRFEEDQKRKPGYPQARQVFAKLRNKDAEVLALLKEYRTRLLAKLKSDAVPKFLQVEDVRAAEIDTVVRMSPDQYASVPLELRYL